MALLSGQRDGLVGRITLELDLPDIDVAHEVATLKHEETVLHGCRITDFDILPIGRERDIGVFAISPVTELAVEIAGLRALDGHRHLIGLAYRGGDVGHGQKLHVPRVGIHLGAMDVESILGIIIQ